MSQTATWGAMHRDSQPQSTCQGFSTEAEQLKALRPACWCSSVLNGLWQNTTQCVPATQ